MIIATAAIAAVKAFGKSFLQKKGEQYINSFFGNATKFERELTGVINETIEQYKSLYPQKEQGEKFPFYDSQLIINELLKHSFFEDYDVNFLQNTLQSQPNLISPSSEQLIEFYKLFKSNLSKHKNLKQLEIEFTHKEKIVKIYEQVTEISSSLNRTVIQIDDSLRGEYIRQLKEIRDDIRNFKPRSALKRLATLEESIKDAGKLTDDIQGRIYFLKGLCYEDIGEDEAHKDFYIKAYKLNKNDFDYELRAAVQYFNNKDSEKAEELVSLIIDKDDYNPNAWFIKFALAEGSLDTKLVAVPKKVGENKIFLILVYNWYFSLRDFDTVKRLQDGYLKTEHLQPKSPSSITHDNKQYWNLISMINVNLYHQQNSLNPFAFKEDIVDDGRVDYLKNLLQLFDDRFRHSEVQDRFRLHFFYSSYFKALFDDEFELYELQKDFSLVEKPVIGNVLSLIQVLISRDEIDTATQYITSYTPTEEESKSGIKELVSCILFKVQGKKLEALKNLKAYVDCFERIDDMVLYNLLNNIEDVFTSTEEVTCFKCDILKKEFEDNHLQTIFEFFVNALLGIKNENSDEIEKVIQSVNQEGLDGKFKFFVAKALYKYGKIKECTSFLKEYVKTDRPSNELYLYIWSLIDYKESDKAELIRLLKWWRLNVGLKWQFLETEIFYRQYLEDWGEIEGIAEVAYKSLPNENGHFLFLYLLALNHQEKKDSISNLSEKVINTTFLNEIDAINTSIIYAQNGLFETAMEVLYNCAKFPENKRARQAIISNTAHYPNSLFTDYSDVVDGSYVLYEMDGKEDIIEIKTDSDDAGRYSNAFLGKKVNEEILIKESIGFSFRKANIRKIMNKYSALFNIIIREAESPTSGLKLKKFSLGEEDISFQSFEKQLVAEFGAEGTMFEELRKKQFKSYYNAEISFTEICTSIFQDNFIDAYNYLTSSFSEGFITLPTSFNKTFHKNDGIKYILDASSIILFASLKKNLQVEFSERFYVSPALIEYVKNQIIETRLARESKMSLSITVEGVRPMLYPDNYNEQRLEYLNELLSWINDNCIPLIIERRIEFHSFLAKEKDESQTLKAVVDAFLGLENGYVLVSSDLFCVRHLRQYNHLIISPQLFLNSTFPNRKEQIAKLLLNLRYIGIDLNENILFEELQKNKKGQVNSYSNALVSLNWFFNSNPEIFGIAIRLIKLVYLNSLFTDEERTIICQRILLSILSSIFRDNKAVRLIRLIIYHEFNLLGTALYVVMNELDKSIDILNGK